MQASRLAILLLVFASSGHAALAASPVFTEEASLALYLEGPFTLINDERDKSKRYDGYVAVKNEAGEVAKISTNFEVRGNWRLKKENCRYAQLWLDLKKEETLGTAFAGQNRLKLVVQCGRHHSFEQYILKEQLAYDLFALFSDYHFKTRLTEITFSESEDKDDSYTALGFLIEHPKHLAARYDLEQVEENTVALDQHDSLQANLVAMFMYLIGNTDYSVLQGPISEPCCHNAELLVSDSGLMIPVPFDFDNSGFVDASYAAGPSPNVRLSSTKDRLFRGHCAHLDTLDEAIAIARATETGVLDAINGSEGLTAKVRRETLKFVKAYYKTLANPENVETLLYNKCRP